MIPENFKSTKFFMACVGIVLCFVWPLLKLDKEYLILALGFVSIYTIGNVTEKFK